MNFIFFGNGEYTSKSNNLDKIIKNINGKDEYSMVIYGGNYLSKSDEDITHKNDINTSKNNISKFLESINKLSSKKKNLILFGDYDLSNTIIFQTEIDFYKKSNNKFIIFNNVTKDFVIDDSIIIIFDSISKY